MEPRDCASPPGLRAMRGDVDVDLGMLRALLGEQAQVLQSANHQAFEESFTRVQQIWDESLAQVEAKVAEQKVVLQQLSNRCCDAGGKVTPAGRR